MRLGAAICAAAVLAALGAAAADEVRYMPAVGTVATYRLLFAITIGGHEVMLGQVYRLTTTASDGTTAEATLTPLALVYRCPDSETSKDCRQARNYPGITRDGDLITVPVPPDIAANLAKLSKLSGRDFLRVAQTLPMPGAENLDEIDKPRIGATALFLQSTTIECDDAVTKGFFPLGVAAQLTVACKTATERSQSRSPIAKDTKIANEINMGLSFAGRDHIAVPAGDFAVATVKFKATPASGDGAVSEGDWAIIESLGITARNSALVHVPSSPNTTHVTRELIKLGP